MTAKARITSKRQITLPVAVFSQLGLSRGDTLLIEVFDNKLIMQNSKDTLSSLAGSVQLPKKFSRLSLDEIISKSKEEYLLNEP